MYGIIYWYADSIVTVTIYGMKLNCSRPKIASWTASTCLYNGGDGGMTHQSKEEKKEKYDKPFLEYQDVRSVL